MKELIIAASLYLLCGQEANAQFYGQINYSNPSFGTANVIASSANITSAYSNGYIATSYVPFTALGTWQIIVRKTDPDGAYSTSDEFHNAIAVLNSQGNNCVGNNSIANNCYGVTAIETNIGASTTGSRYALVAAMSGAAAGKFIAFITLNKSGTPVNYVYYNFPVNVSSFKKPYISEDISSPGNYYICGSYIPSAPGSNEITYVLRVNISGSISWSRTYSCGLGIEPRAIIKSPFNSNEIAIVGRVEPDPSVAPFLNRSDDGFFMKLNASSGVVNLFRVYGNDLVHSEHQYFCSISPANSTYGGGNGFVIGGMSQRLNNVLSNPQGTWMLKVNQTNGAVQWSTIIDNGGLGAVGEATGVFERFNAGAFTYFCGASMNSSIRALKLDNSGTLYTGGSGNNQFDYNWMSPGTPITFPTQITNLNGTTADGFQLFSTNGSASGQDNYFVKAYFDGNSGCNEILGAGVQNAGPSNTISPITSTAIGLSLGSCPNFFLDWHSTLGTTANMSYKCSTNVITGASNARMLTTTLENYNSVTTNLLNAYPNPNNGSFIIESNHDIKISVVNSLCQIVKTIELNSTNNFKIDITGLSAGIYFVKAQGADQVTGYKIIVEK